MNRSMLAKLCLLAVALFLGMNLPSIAFGVAPTSLIKDGDAQDSVTTGAAVRARADVQIRRIKNLIVTKSSDSDADYQRLEKLQKDLRGER